MANSMRPNRFENILRFLLYEDNEKLNRDNNPLMKYFITERQLSYDIMLRSKYIWQLSSSKERNFTEKREKYVVSTISKDGGVILAKWVDNALVSVASTDYGIHPNIKQYSQKEKKHVSVSRPSIVTEYNKYMGETDRMDQFVAQYRINIHIKKLYYPLLS